MTRDADMEIDEDDAEDLLKEIQRQLKKRRWGQVIRLEVEEGINKKLLKILKDELASPGREYLYVQRTAGSDVLNENVRSERL